ncbi:hypothetical protein [Streptomyces ferrugineus]|nr:hypothetical protein [Streptomyces ferrugineus]
MDRIRSDAGPLLRLLAFAVLLFGVLVTHGVHVESVQGHLSTSAMAAAGPAADGARHGVVDPVPQFAAEGDVHHGGGHESTQPGEQCASGQPQQGSALALPCLAASVRASAGADDASTVRLSAADRAVDGASPAALRAASVVQQV